MNPGLSRSCEAACFQGRQVRMPVRRIHRASPCNVGCTCQSDAHESSDPRRSPMSSLVKARLVSAVALLATLVLASAAPIHAQSTYQPVTVVDDSGVQTSFAAPP